MPVRPPHSFLSYTESWIDQFTRTLVVDGFRAAQSKWRPSRMLCLMPTGFRLLILSPTHPPMVRASPGRHVTSLTPGPMPGHHVTATPGLSHHLFAGSPRLGPPALSYAPASFLAVPHPARAALRLRAPQGALSSAIKPMSNTGYRSATPRIKHRERILHALGSSPTLVGSSPHARCPAAIVTSHSKHREQTSMLQGNPLRLSWDNGPAQTAARRSTDCAPNRHPTARGSH